MSATEKFLFLGAVAVAALVMTQTPQEPDVVPSAFETDSSPDSPAPAPEKPAPDKPPPTVLTVSPTATGYLKILKACPDMETSHAADIGQDLKMTDFKPVVLVHNKVRLASAPVGAACFASPFGMRDGKMHKGVDYYNADPVPVYAAANGRVRTRIYRNDYGNMLVIDHGNGVYTRYAHLESFGDAGVGDDVQAGDVIGVMGHTAGYKIARHLHYEVLTGTWQFAAGSFALTPVDVMSLPEAD